MYFGHGLGDCLSAGVIVLIVAIVMHFYKVFTMLKTKNYYSSYKGALQV